MDTEQLADFLRTRRAGTAPEGSEGTGPRKVAGLRREEVAERAGISADYYTRLEQNRTSRPSEQVLDALAGAFGLDEAERAHMFRLAGHAVPPKAPRAGEPDASLYQVMSHLERVPAHVMTDLGWTLAQNPLSRAVFGDLTAYEGVRRSSYHRWFTDPAARRAFSPETHEAESRARVAALRATAARRNDPAAHALIRQLRAESPEFASLWTHHAVAERSGAPKRLLTPEGPLEMTSHFLTATSPDQLLIVFTPTQDPPTNPER